MDYAMGNRESSSSCSFHFFDCLPRQRDEERPRCSNVPSVMRETNVTYQQPHLVEPMTLRVYEDLPATPATHDTFQLPQWGRTLASRASSRASRISMKRRATLKSLISKPHPEPEVGGVLPFRRRQEFSPLQLSIYKDSRRLSDLPEFDNLSFTELGELKSPPKALVRTQSEDMLRSHHRLITDSPRRRASMYETSNAQIARPGTACSIVSTSRPPSEYDALHSHPVSLASLPGIAAPKSQKPENMVAILTPMQEEFSPVPTAVSVDGTILTFPKTVQLEPTTIDLQKLPRPESQAPYPVISQGPSGVETNEQQNPTRRHVHNNSQTQKRVSQWLHYRSQSGSVSTIGSVSTTASFAEHRRRRVEFYKLGQQAHGPVTIPASPPQPLNFPSARPLPLHQRTNTETSQHTVGTSVLSSTFDGDSKQLSQESVTTLSMTDVKSRAGTVKSLGSLKGLRIVAGDKHLPFSSALIGAAVEHKSLYLSEINGPLRSPGVGIAF